jgi:hypothetical protein
MYDQGTMALESITSDLTQGPAVPATPSFFKPVNIAVKNGIHFVTIYACEMINREKSGQAILLFFESLKADDHVKLTISSTMMGLPIQVYLPLLGAISRCVAEIEIQLDSIVCDELAYFYLAAPKINKGTAGALYIPSYLDSRYEDKSVPWLAVNDFVAYLVDQAVARGLLTSDEANRLHGTKPVSIPNDRFATLA